MINTKPSGGLLVPESEREREGEQDTQQRAEREKVIEGETIRETSREGKTKEGRKR